MDASEPKDAERQDHPLSALEAFEAVAEGVAGSVALTPGGPVPSLGGEMLLPDGGGDGVEVGADTVRTGIMQAGPLAIAGVAVNAVNVLVTILVARLLTTRDYGLLNQLNGIFLIISMPGSAVIVGIVRRVTMWLSDGEGHRIRDWARRVHTQGTLIAVAFFITMVVTGEWVASLLNQPNAVGVVAIVGAGAVWILLSLDRGLLQAHRVYRTLAINLIVEGAARTVAIVGFVLIGAGASGIAVGILLAEVTTAIHARISADRVWDHEARIERPEGLVRHALRLIGHPVSTVRSWLRHLERDPMMVSQRELKVALVSDLVVALAALAMLAILQNIDVIILGRDNPKMSGSYAAVSVASKAIVYGAVVLGSYLLPEAAIRWREGGHALRQTAVAVVLLSIPASALLVLSQFFPRLLLELVFGPRYLGAQAAFAPLVGAMICLSLSVILTMYLLAVGWRWVSGVLVIGAGALVGAVIAAHGDPVSTARNDFFVQGILLAGLTIAFIAIHQMRKAPAAD